MAPLNGEVWAALGGALLTLIAALVALPKVRAEARKANAEADNTIEARLLREIARVDRELGEVRLELATVKASAADEKTLLEKENHRLRLEVGSLRRRIGQLEEIIKTRTTPEDMRAQLAAMERGTGASDK